MRPWTAPRPATGSALLLDQLSVAPAGAWWLQKLRTAYAGACIKVRRASNNNTLDIGFGSDGFVDEAAIAGFCGASDGYIDTQYDQSGNSKHLTQANTAWQHRIYVGATGLLNRRNGKPTFLGDGVVVLRGVVASSLGIIGNPNFTMGLRWRRVAGRTDALAFGYGGGSGNESMYAWTVSDTQMRVALAEAGSSNVTFNTVATAFTTYQSAVFLRSAGTAMSATRYRQNGVEISVASSAGGGVPNFDTTSRPIWLTYRDVGATNTIETTPGAVVWGAVLGSTDLATYEAFLSTYT